MNYLDTSSCSWPSFSSWPADAGRFLSGTSDLSTNDQIDNPSTDLASDQHHGMFMRTLGFSLSHVCRGYQKYQFGCMKLLLRLVAHTQADSTLIAVDNDNDCLQPVISVALATNFQANDLRLHPIYRLAA